MEIKNAKYIKNFLDTSKNASIKADVDGIKVCIPIDSDNREYKEMLIQVGNGTITIAEADSI